MPFLLGKTVHWLFNMYFFPMPFQVAIQSKKVLLPIALENVDGGRLMRSLSRLDTATAMLIQVSSTGQFEQEFFPLKISQDSLQAYDGLGFELWSQKAGADFQTYYLGIPDTFFAAQPSGLYARSLSIQVIGASQLSEKNNFSGGLDISLQVQVQAPLIPRFLNLCERFFPTLLSQPFIAQSAVDVFDFEGQSQVLLMASLQMDATEAIPMSLEKKWDAKGWIDATVENLLPGQDGIIRGGCFYDRNGKVTHWFGGKIGLRAKEFRQIALDKIKSLGLSRKGAWVFWIDLSPNLSQISEQNFAQKFRSQSKNALSIRHPIYHRLLKYAPLLNTQGFTAIKMEMQGGVGDDETELEGLPAKAVAQSLFQVAKILERYSSLLGEARQDPVHAPWSELPPSKKVIDDFLEVSSSNSRLKKSGRDTVDPHLAAKQLQKMQLESEIESLFQSHGEILRSLETLFDQTFGYSAWDSIGQPLRESLNHYLLNSIAKIQSKGGALTLGRVQNSIDGELA